MINKRPWLLAAFGLFLLSIFIFMWAFRGNQPTGGAVIGIAGAGMPNPSGIVAAAVLLGIALVLMVIVGFSPTPPPAEVALYYHRRGEQAYERGAYEQAKRYYERAADIRKRNLL